jgi:hypothetical protein
MRNAEFRKLLNIIWLETVGGVRYRKSVNGSGSEFRAATGRRAATASYSKKVHGGSPSGSDLSNLPYVVTCGKCNLVLYRLPPRLDILLADQPKSRQARRARALRTEPSCPPMLGKDGLYFLVGGDLTAGYGRKRLVDRLELLGCRVIDTVPSRLDFEGDLRELILVVLGPMRDPRQYLFYVCIHVTLSSTTSVRLHAPWQRRVGGERPPGPRSSRISPASVARVERSETRDRRCHMSSTVPDFTSFNPGYACWSSSCRPSKAPRRRTIKFQRTTAETELRAHPSESAATQPPSGCRTRADP